MEDIEVLNFSQVYYKWITLYKYNLHRVKIKRDLWWNSCFDYKIQKISSQNRRECDQSSYKRAKRWLGKGYQTWGQSHSIQATSLKVSSLKVDIFHNRSKAEQSITFERVLDFMLAIFFINRAFKISKDGDHWPSIRVVGCCNHFILHLFGTKRSRSFHQRCTGKADNLWQICRDTSFS